MNLLNFFQFQLAACGTKDGFLPGLYDGIKCQAVLEAAARLLREIGWGRTLRTHRYDLSWRMSYHDWSALGSLPSDQGRHLAVDHVNCKLFAIPVRWTGDEEQDLELAIRPVHR